MGSNDFSRNVEDSYLAETTTPLVNENFIVISGCSGGGKSSILSSLAVRGYAVVIEPGRQIVKEQTLIDGEALPWVNLDKFLDLALSRYLFLYNSQSEKKQLLFFDRGIIDALQIDRPQPPYFDNSAKKFRYNPLVFLVPPWKEIFAGDKERKHTFASAKKEFDELLVKYKKYGYETVLIPKLPVEERVDFILNRVDSRKQRPKSGSSIDKAKRLLEWNREKLTNRSDLQIADLEELFAAKFVVLANGRKYEADHQSYYDFLNEFRATIAAISYQVQEYIDKGSSVVMPLTATVERVGGNVESFEAILLLKFDEWGKIVHWQEVYATREV